MSYATRAPTSGFPTSNASGSVAASLPADALVLVSKYSRGRWCRMYAAVAEARNASMTTVTFRWPSRFAGCAQMIPPGPEFSDALDGWIRTASSGRSRVAGAPPGADERGYSRSSSVMWVSFSLAQTHSSSRLM